MRLPGGAAKRRTRGDLRDGEHAGEIESAALPVIDGSIDVEEIDPADQFIEGPDAERGHDFARFRRDKPHEIHAVFRLARESPSKLGVLRGNADRAGIQVTLAHHDAAQGDQRDGAESELLGPEQRGDDHVAAGAQLPVDLYADAVAQMVHDERLLGIGEADLPRDAGILDR